MSAAAKAWKFAYVVLMLAMASAGTMNMLSGAIRDEQLWGVESEAKKPLFRLSQLITETFQKDATTWFEQHFGLRGIAIKTDNTLNIKLFRETRAGQPTRILDRGVLIKDEDITYFGRVDGPQESIAAAKRFAHVQRRLREKGKLLLPVILPSKSSQFADMIPRAWRREGAAGLTDTNVYGAFARTLRQEQALFVDGRALLQGFGDGRFDVFPRTGRHWSTRAACFILQHVTDAVRTQFVSIGTTQVDCAVKPKSPPALSDEEYDLFRLLNDWSALPTDFTVWELSHPKSGAAIRVPTLFVGSSFLWKLVRLTRELDAYRPSLFYYYDKTIFETETETAVGKVEPFSAKWRDETFSKDLIVVDVLETYLPVQGMDFLSELEKELDDPSSPIHASRKP